AATCRRMLRRFYGRELFIEQTVAILGQALVAPIPDARLVILSPELIGASTWLRCLTPGICHAVRWIDHVHDIRDAAKVVDANPDGLNRQRLAALAVLIGWMSDTPGDTQYLLEQPPPHRVFSADHGLLAHG